MLSGQELLECLRSLGQEGRREFVRQVGAIMTEGVPGPSALRDSGPGKYGLAAYQETLDALTPEQRAALDRASLL